jgi:hypothetical protein
LPSHEICGGLTVRSKVIASILRFADELSDDNTRANRFGEINEQNTKYHEYSKSLFPINIDYNTIAFIYDIPYSSVIEKINASPGKIYLYDEILNRLTKCMCELEYCRKYSDGFIIITTLYITINILQEHNLLDCEKKLKFELRLSGYPDINIEDFKTYLDRPDDFEFDNGETLRLNIISRNSKKGGE